MKLLSLALLTALTACGRSVDMYPVGVGGGGTGGSTGGGGVDAPGDGIAGSTINGRVCMISDARSPLACATTGAAGLIVTLGSAVTTAMADGHFSIVPANNTDLEWRVSGAAIQASAMQLRYGSTIPAITKTTYDNMVAANQAVSGDGSGALMARFTLAATPIAGLQAITTPAAESVIHYDNNVSATTWSVDQTGSYGVVWVPGLVGSTVEISLSGASNAAITGIPIFANTVSFVLAEVQ